MKTHPNGLKRLSRLLVERNDPLLVSKIKKTTKKIFKIPMYYESGETKLMVYIADKLTDVKTFVECIDDPDDYDGVDAVVFNWNNHIRVIFERKHIDAGRIAHEAIHIKNRIFKYSGIENDPDNDEPEAYLVQWIVNKIHGVLAKDNEE